MNMMSEILSDSRTFTSKCTGSYQNWPWADWKEGSCWDLAEAWSWAEVHASSTLEHGDDAVLVKLGHA
ncbi:hypothetical protein PIB30_043954 [Stylosanthes scabra]|uniref:Uncharacterized protein n=1 Tax=Stylosanthes scabra TaxID=79078 RepID=A0ABU6YEI8_9FABA|nr:hypothetical protein [Stylosanthes scabra]